MKRYQVLIVILLFASFSLSAQVACDPEDFLYQDISIWQTMGIIRPLPAARPYPLQLIKGILSDVIERGDGEQRRIAEAHHRRIFGRTYTIGGKSGAAMETYHGYKQLDLGLAFDANVLFTDWVSLSASADLWATNKITVDEIAPIGEGYRRDIVEDNAKVGPMWILPAINSSVALGTDEYYLNAGLMRGSWGPYYDNGVIYGPQALHSGQFNFAVLQPSWGFNMSLYALTATPDDNQQEFYPDKYLSIHSIDWRPYNWITVSFFESVVYGGRFETMYLLPLSPYMVSQGNTGFRDNSYLGGTFSVRPFDGLKVDGTLLADDLSFNDMARLKFDTKWRIAGQIGTSYAPKRSGLLAMLSFDYTMVTPYTYSHKEGESLSSSAPNFQSYTHGGGPLGAALDPNSDRLNLRVRLRPLEGVDFDVVGILIRHGNVNEGMDDRRIREYLTAEDSYITDGSINNSSATDSGHAFFYSTPFLSQDTIQYIWQTGFDITCRLPVLKTGGYMVFRLGYRFEYNINPGINREIYTYDSSLVNADGSLADDEVIQAAAARQLSEWKDQATGKRYNNYIRLGMEYFF